MAKYVTILDNKARTVNEDSKVIRNNEKEGAVASHIVVKITSGSNLVLTVKGYDQLSASTYTLLTSSVLASGVSVLKVGPDYTAAANIAKDYLPAEFLVSATLSGATTFSVGASLI